MSKKDKNEKGEKNLQSQSAPAMMNPWNEMERWFNEFGTHGWLHPFPREWPKSMESLAPFEGRTPRVDMIDRDKEIVIRAELPGVKKDDVDDHAVGT